MNKLLKKNKHGYYEVISKPNQSELKNYYEKKYFQQPIGQYQKNYDNDEKRFFQNKASICRQTIKKCLPIINSFFEIGCGEGFFANEFYKMKLKKIILNDYSKEGLKNFNPNLIPFLRTGDVYKHLRDLINQKENFDLISMDHVLEHVIDPEILLKKLKKIMHNKSVLRITVPNDFSAFQLMLIKNSLTEQTWVSPPDHLSYFNSKNLVTFCKAMGYNVISIQCDFPIEVFLTNQNSHYYKDRNLGKEAHRARMLCSNYLKNENVSEYIKFSESAAKLQFGRNITIYLKL